MVLNQRSSVRHTDRLSVNHKLLYHYIRTRGPLARADLVRISDLTFPSISRMVAELLELGLIQETTQRRGGMGKPPTELILVPEAACAVGVALDKTRTEVVVIDAAGTVLEKADIATEEGLSASLQKLLAQLNIPNTKLIGVGVTRLGGGFEASEREALEQELGLPVTSASCAGAGALRERYFGPAQTLDAFLYLDVGEELSSAALLGRRLLAPAHQLSGLADVLGVTLEAGNSAWTSNLPGLSTLLLAAEQLLEPEVLIVGGNVDEAQVEELTNALQERRSPAAPKTPIVKGVCGSEEYALAAATLPLYTTFTAPPFDAK